MIEYLFFINPIAATIYMLLSKFKVFDWVQTRTKVNFIYNLLNCDFCKSFHLTWLTGLIAFTITNEPTLLLFGFVSSPITLKLIK